MLRRLLGDEAFFRGLRLFYEDRRYQKAGTEDLERAMETASGRVLDRFFDRWIYNAELPRLSYRSTIADGSVTVEFEQAGNLVFDVPVTVRLVYVNGQTRDVMVPVTDKQRRAVDSDGEPRARGPDQSRLRRAGGIRGALIVLDDTTANPRRHPADMIGRVWKRSR